MPKPGFAIVGSVLLIAGLIGLYAWTHYEFSTDNKYAIIWASSLGLIGGFQLFLQGLGVNLFSRNGDGGSGGFFSDSDFDGDGGD
jgi:predicted Kef-type K+ transport protein